MDQVRAILILLPDAPIPDAVSVQRADAIVVVPPFFSLSNEDADAEPEPSQARSQIADHFTAIAERVPALLELGPPVYLAIPAIDSGLVRDYLLRTLQPGVYGVATQPPVSVEQLRYLEGVIEDVELRADIRPGLTAMAVGFEHPRALNIMSEALAAMRESADRTTWIAFNHEELAQTLGVEPDSATIIHASSRAILTAAAFDLPVVYGSVADAEFAAALGFRGVATIDPSDLERLRTIFDRPDPEATEAEEDS